MADTAILICPKCRGEMRSYERNGILIDQCEECRGIFLDRGELERLLDAERGYEREEHGHGDRPEDDGDDDHHRDHRHDVDEHKRGRGSRRASASQFLSDFLGGGK